MYTYCIEKHLDNALRCSMENYGSFEYQDVKDNNAVRHVQICPLYAMSQMDKLLSKSVHSMPCRKWINC